jgi:glycosyltransferase involved in cell wall biosynthesis
LTGALPLDDLRKLYVVCDIFVLPSLTEAMPTAPLEAMASGKPVIGTKVGGIPMQIQDGKSGFLIDSEDERQLAERIKHLIDNPSKAKGMGAYGRKLAEEKFDWAIIAEKLLQVYQS